MKNKEERLIEEKATFIKENDQTLYFLLDNKSNASNNTVKEILLSILLSDKPLKECNRYDEINNIINTTLTSITSYDEDENYSLKTLFSVTEYINSCYDESDAVNLKDRIRKYSKYMNGYMKSAKDAGIVLSESQKIKNK